MTVMKQSIENQEHLDTVEFTMTADVFRSELGNWLTCDDPEGHPMTSGAFQVQTALQDKLGWDNAVDMKLQQQAKIEKPRDWYLRFHELAQEWAEAQLRSGKLEGVRLI